MASLLPPLATAAACQLPGSLNDSADVLSKGAQKAAAARIDKFFEAADPVWIACNTLWVFVWVLAPAIVYFRGLAGTWFGLLATGLGILGFILWTYWRAHRALYPDGLAERRSHTILMGVSPLGAIRAVDHLSHRLLAHTHPLVAAMALCPRAESVRLARLLYLRAGPTRRFPQAVSGGGRPVVRRHRPSRRGRGGRNGVLPALPRAVRSLGRDVLGLFGGSAGEVGASGAHFRS